MKQACEIMTELPLVFADDHVTKARQILRDDGFREVYVQDHKKRLMGYIDITDVLQITDTKSNITVEGFLKDAVTVEPCDTLETTAQKIAKGNTDSAAVVEANGEVLGAVLLSEIFPILITRHELRGVVGDVMSRKVVTCAPDDHIPKIYNLIVESGFTAFPVVKNKEIIGMVSRRDILAAGRVRKSMDTTVHTKVEKNAANIRIDSVMITPVISIGPDAPLSEAADQLIRHDISRMPVIENRKIEGIVDRHDVLKGLIVKTG